MSILEVPDHERHEGTCWAGRPELPLAFAAIPERGESLQPHGKGNVLVVDDSAVARRYLKAVLLGSRACEIVLLADSGSEGMRLLEDNDVDLVLSDLNMPGLSGFEFLMRMHADQALAEIPVIMLTGEEDFQSKLRCLQSGAADYLLKPFSDEELVARVRIHLKLKSLQDELRRKNEQLRALAQLDSLTGISNRHHFFACLERELGRAQRQGLPLALGMIDIDHFKRINDDYGHLCGDQALTTTARLLRSGLRDYDLLGRYGGEEFAALFVDARADDALMIAERCRRRVAESAFELGGCEVKLTVSVGLAYAVEPRPGMATELISRADEALYVAKLRGRNRVVVAQEELACAPSAKAVEVRQ